MIKGEELSFGESASGRHAVEADSKTPPKTPPKTPQKTPPKTPPKLPTAPPTPTPFKRPSASGARFKRPAAAAEEELPVEDGQAVEENVEENVEEKKQPKSGSGANVISSISHKGGWKEQMVETKSGRKYARFLDKDGKQCFLAVPEPLTMVSWQIRRLRSELERSWRMKKSQQHAAAKQYQYHHVEPYMTQSTLIVKPPTFSNNSLYVFHPRLSQACVESMCFSSTKA